MASDETSDYRLDDQIGFLLRKANQRHTGIFSELMPEGLTPTRFAALAKLRESGTLSQNALGRMTAMDVATIKGVVDRLRTRGLVASRSDPADGRRQLIELTDEGAALVNRAVAAGLDVTAKTVDPLSASEQDALISLLRKIA